jgi:hypothetical protein
VVPSREECSRKSLRDAPGSRASIRRGMISDGKQANAAPGDAGESEAARLARLALFAFIITFIVARIMVLLIMARRVPNLYFFLRGTHVHHLNYGIFLLAGVGAYLLLRLPSGKSCAAAHWPMESHSRSPSTSSACGCTSAAATGSARAWTRSSWLPPSSRCSATPPPSAASSPARARLDRPARRPHRLRCGALRCLHEDRQDRGSTARSARGLVLALT